MSERVTAFWPVQSGVFDYLFFVTNWNDYSSTISKSLEDNLEIFGSDLALKGKVIEAYSHAKWETFKEITDKEEEKLDIKTLFRLYNISFYCHCTSLLPISEGTVLKNFEELIKKIVPTIMQQNKIS